MTPNSSKKERSVSFKKTTSWRNYGATNGIGLDEENGGTTTTTQELPLLDHTSPGGGYYNKRLPSGSSKILNRLHSDLHPPIGRGKATILSEVFNISKNLIGGGVLSLSGGIALFADNPRASFAAIIWVILLGAAFGYFCVIIGKSCEMTQSVSYRECWERSVGQRGALAVSILNILDPLLGIYANATILSQSLQLLLEGIDVYWSINKCLLIITLVGILPLCLMKHLNALAPFSAIGMIAVVSALIAMIVRLVDGSYRPGGYYYDDIPQEMQPKFGNTSRPWSTSALPFVCMVYTSFDMHYNSPSFYAELKDASISRYSQTCAYAFSVTGALYFSIAVVGFLTFGSSSDSYILNNYAATDPLATVSRLAIGLCSLASYPLNYIGVRDNILEILGWTDYVEDDRTKLSMFTLVLLTILTVTELYVTDLGLINSVGGGTTVTLICFVCPALMFRESIRKHGSGSSGNVDDDGIITDSDSSDDDSDSTAAAAVRRERREVWLVMVLMVVGVILGIIGVVDSIRRA